MMFVTDVIQSITTYIILVNTHETHFNPHDASTPAQDISIGGFYLIFGGISYVRSFYEERPRDQLFQVLNSSLIFACGASRLLDIYTDITGSSECELNMKYN